MRRAACLLFSVAAVSAILIVHDQPAVAQSSDRDTLGEPRNEGAGPNVGATGQDGSRNAPQGADGSDDAGTLRRQRRQEPGSTSTADGDGQQPPANAKPAPQPARVKTRDPIAEKLNRVEQAAETPPHPLAAAHPGQNVVVCIAGCPKGRETIVHIGRQAASAEGSGGLVATAASAVAPDTGPQQIVCLAGCYSGPKAYKAYAPGIDRSADTASASGNPLPTLVSLPAKPVGSSQTTAAADDGEPRSRRPRLPVAAAAKASKAAAHWFTSRFRR